MKEFVGLVMRHGTRMSMLHSYSFLNKEFVGKTGYRTVTSKLKLVHTENKESISKKQVGQGHTQNNTH